MRVLYVATDLRDADVLQQEVRRGSPTLTFDVCAGVAELQNWTERQPPYDVLLMDASLSEPEQLQLIHFVRSRHLPLPIVAFVAQGAALPTAALTAGADDCVVRQQKMGERLGATLRLSVERYRLLASAMRENEKLRRSEARLRIVIEALPAGVILADPTGKILAMNLAGAMHFGAPGPQDMVGRSVSMLVRREDHEHVTEFLEKVIAGEERTVFLTPLDVERAPHQVALQGVCIMRDGDGGPQVAVLGALKRAESKAPGEDDLAALTAAKADAAHAHAALDEARAALADHVTRLAALEQHRQTADTRAQAAESQSQADTATAVAEARRAADLEARIASVQAAAQTAAQTADAAAQEAHAHAASLELRAQSAEARILDLMAEADRIRTDLKAAQASQSSAEDVNKLLSDLGEECQRLERELAQSRTKQTEAETRAQENASAFSALSAELEGAKAQLSSLAQDLDRQREAATQLQSVLTKRSDDASAAEARTQARVAEMAQAHKVEADRLQRALDQAIAREAQASQALATVRSQAPQEQRQRRRGPERVGQLASAMATDLNAAVDKVAEAVRRFISEVPQELAAREQAEVAVQTARKAGELAKHLLKLSSRYMTHTESIDLSQVVRAQEPLLHQLLGGDIEVHFDLENGLLSSELDAQEAGQVLTTIAVTARDALPLGGVLRIVTGSGRPETPEQASRYKNGRPLMLAVTAQGYGIRPVSSATCEDVISRCGGLLSTIIEPNVAWTLIATLPGDALEPLAPSLDLTRTA